MSISFYCLENRTSPIYIARDGAFESFGLCTVTAEHKAMLDDRRFFSAIAKEFAAAEANLMI